MNKLFCLLAFFAVTAGAAYADKASYSQLDFDIALEACLENTRADIREVSPEKYDIGITAERLYSDCTFAMTDRLALLDSIPVQGTGVPTTHYYTEAWRRANAVIERENAEHEIIGFIGPEEWAEAVDEACLAEAEADAEDSGSDRGVFSAIEICTAQNLAGRWLVLTNDTIELCMSPAGYTCAARTLPIEFKGRVEISEPPETVTFYSEPGDAPTALLFDPDDLPFAATDQIRILALPERNTGIVIDWMSIYEPELVAVSGITENAGDRAAVRPENGDIIILNNRVPWQEGNLGRPLHMAGAWFTPKDGDPEFGAHYKRFTD